MIAQSSLHTSSFNCGVQISIDLSAAVANWRALDALSGTAETGATVKANAYGLGADKIAPALATAGCETFFVALPEEALRLRSILGVHKKIFALNGHFNEAECVKEFVAKSITPVLSSPEQVQFWHQHAEHQPFALQIDTGMNRLGLSADEFEAYLASGAADSIALLMSHLACADQADHEMNKTQLRRFQDAHAKLPDVPASLANSAGHFLGEHYMFALTRPGIAIYGGAAQENTKNTMKPVVEVFSRILQIRRTLKGESVGYGATFQAKRDSDIAICSIGYADGYTRNTSNNDARAFYGDQEVPIIGRISMDLVAVDISDVPEQKRGSNWVEFIGKNITLDDAAKAAGTIGYELLTQLSNRANYTYL